METKEYYEVVKKYRRNFWGMFSLILILGGLFYFYYTQDYKATVSVEITRKTQAARKVAISNFEYDQFYRLEADKAYGQNLAMWLSDPNFVGKVFKDAKISLNQAANPAKIFALQKEKDAPSVALIIYKVSGQAQAEKFYIALKNNLNQKNDNLNAANESDWFKLNLSGPFVAKQTLPALVFFTALILAAAILGFVFSLMVYYWKEAKHSKGFYENWD